MIVGKVVGNIVCTRKTQQLVGYKLLMVKPLFENNQEIIIAADTLGAGVGECVLITTNSTTQYALEKSVPVDALIVGIVDQEPDYNLIEGRRV